MQVEIFLDFLTSSKIKNTFFHDPKRVVKDFLIKFTKNHNLAVSTDPENILSTVSIDSFTRSAYSISRENPTSHISEMWRKIMLANAFVDNTEIMAKGQIPIPKDVRDVLGVSNGNLVTFIVEGKTVHIVNSAVYAMQVLQQEMAGEAERTVLISEDDVMALVKELRNEGDIQQEIPKPAGGTGQISFRRAAYPRIGSRPNRERYDRNTK